MLHPDKTLWPVKFHLHWAVLSWSTWYQEMAMEIKTTPGTTAAPML